MQEAYAQAQLDPLQTTYVEAHGTGTRAGDPIEVEAIAAALSMSRQSSSPLFLGSVKSNIGHLESASGIAGLIKAILCVEKAMLVPNINFHKENDSLHLAKRNMKVSVLCDESAALLIWSRLLQSSNPGLAMLFVEHRSIALAMAVPMLT